MWKSSSDRTSKVCFTLLASICFIVSFYHTNLPFFLISLVKWENSQCLIVQCYSNQTACQGSSQQDWTPNKLNEIGIHFLN